MANNSDVITEQPSCEIEMKPNMRKNSEERGNGGFWWCGRCEQKDGDKLPKKKEKEIDRPTAEADLTDECPSWEVCCQCCCEIGIELCSEDVFEHVVPAICEICSDCECSEGDPH